MYSVPILVVITRLSRKQQLLMGALAIGGMKHQYLERTIDYRRAIVYADPFKLLSRVEFHFFYKCHFSVFTLYIHFIVSPIGHCNR